MTDITQKLPLELLAEILERASVPDVLRFKQVCQETFTHVWIKSLNVRGVCRSTVSFVTPFSHLLQFNTR
jgi:hypothetical protein